MLSFTILFISYFLVWILPNFVKFYVDHKLVSNKKSSSNLLNFLVFVIAFGLNMILKNFYLNGIKLNKIKLFKILKKKYKRCQYDIK